MIPAGELEYKPGPSRIARLFWPFEWPDFCQRYSTALTGRHSYSPTTLSWGSSGSHRTLCSPVPEPEAARTRLDHEVDAASQSCGSRAHLRHRDDSIDADPRIKSQLSQCAIDPPPSGSQAVLLLAETTATIATASSPCPEQPSQDLHPTPAVQMERRSPVSSISSSVHPHDTSQDSDDPEAQPRVLPDDATLLPASRPVASRGIVDTRICRSLSSCNVNATPLQEQGPS